MRLSAEPLRLAKGEAFLATSRALFGPIKQSFPWGGEQSVPKLLSVDLGACRLSEIRANAHVVVNDCTAWRSFDPDAIKILMLVDGRSRFEQARVAYDLQPRGAVIYDPVRPYRLESSSAVHHLILQVPRSTFSSAALTRLESPVNLHTGECSMTRIVSGLMEMAIAESARLDAQSLRRVGDSLVQLVDGLIRTGAPEPEHRPTPSLTALRERIVAFVDANIGRSDLSADEIARQMGCSRRYLHRAFEGEGATLDRFIWDRRLERSRAALADGGIASISEIAFSCGFNSSAHFSRAFKSRYEITPRQFRGELRSPLH